MIAANELRIGNWVEASELGKVKVHEILFGSTWVVFKHMTEDREIQESRQKIYNSNIHPIPLTPEILGKCGFVKDSDGCLYIGWPNNSCKIYWVPVEDSGIIQLAIGYAPMANFKVQSLHQLQNLYFSLTGQELNVQL